MTTNPQRSENGLICPQDVYCSQIRLRYGLLWLVWVCCGPLQLPVMSFCCGLLCSQIRVHLNHLSKHSSLTVSI